MAEEEDFEAAPPPPPPPQGFDHFVRQNPAAAVIGALVAGFLLGRLGIL
jgi:hypothetical protein